MPPPTEAPAEVPGVRPGNGVRARIMASFAALALFLSVAEQLFPRPLPFFRLGLSNLAVLAALDFMPFPALLALTALKVLGQALLSGTLVSYIFIFSAAGSLASLLAAYGLRRLLKEKISLIGLGAAGALASNLAQVSLSIAFIFGRTAMVIAPVLLGIGTVTGVLLGSFAQGFRDRSAWLARVASAWKGQGR